MGTIYLAFVLVWVQFKKIKINVFFFISCHHFHFYLTLTFQHDEGGNLGFSNFGWGPESQIY